MPQKWMKVATQKHHAEHLERVRSMKCSVDCTAPREKIEKNRTVEKLRKGFMIERDNRILLDRLGVALEHKNIDNENKYYQTRITKQKTRRTALSGKAQIELAKITSDNKELLKRMENVLPTYSFSQYEAEDVVHKKHLRVLTEYPDQYQADPQFAISQTRKLSNKELARNMVDPVTNEFQYMHSTAVFTSSRAERSLHRTRTALLGRSGGSSIMSASQLKANIEKELNRSGNDNGYNNISGSSTGTGGQHSSAFNSRSMSSK